MRMTRTIGMSLAAILMAGGIALADRPESTCAAEAREEAQECRAECTNDYRNARFLCRNVEPGCGRECLGERESCIDDATEPLETCLRGCRAGLGAAKADCRTSCSGDAACLDACVDAAQVAALTCRDDCREAFRANGGPAAIEQCRQEFRTCVDACPPARSH